MLIFSSEKTQKAKHAYKVIFCVSLFFRALQASKEVSETKELPDESWDSRKRCNSTCLFVCFHFLALIGFVAKEMRKADK